MCGCLSSAPYWGTWPPNQACALTGNQTGNPCGLQTGTQSTEPHQPGLYLYIFNWDITWAVISVYVCVCVCTQQNSYFFMSM